MSGTGSRFGEFAGYARLVGSDEAWGRNKGLKLVWRWGKDELFQPLEGGICSGGVVGVGFGFCCQLHVAPLLELVTGVGLENREEGLVDVMFVFHTQDESSRWPDILLRTKVAQPIMFFFAYAQKRRSVHDEGRKAERRVTWNVV